MPDTEFSRRAVATYGTNLMVAALSLASVLITSKALGAVGRGDIAFLTTTAFLAAQLGALGLGPATIVAAGRQPEQSGAIAATAVVLAAGLGLVAVVAAGVLLAVVSPEASSAVPWWVLALLGAGVPAVIWQVSLLHLAQAHYRFTATNLAWLIPPAVNVTVNLTLAVTGHLTVTSAVLAWVCGQVLATGLLATVTWRLVGLARPRPDLARNLLSFGARSHLARVLLISNYRIDQWILGALAGSAALGTYSVAVAWSESLFFLPTALAAVQRPDLVRLDRAGAGRLASQVFRVAAALTVPLALGLVVAAPILTTWLFGADFAPSAGQLRILVLGALGVAALKIVGNALNAQGRPLLESAAVGVSFVAIMVLDLALIPTYGAGGAAVASALAYTAGGVAAIVIFSRTLGVPVGALVPRRADGQWLRSLVQRRVTAAGASPPPSASDTAEDSPRNNPNP